MTLLPVLTYHGIECASGEYGWTAPEKPYGVSVSVFEKQVKLIVDSGFQSLALDETGKWLSGKRTYHRPILITFDDGHLSHYEHAAAYLKKNKVKAVFFISAGLVGKKNQMNWTQLKELVRDGFEIGSHGLTHIPLTNLPAEELKYELKGSKDLIERKLAIEVKGFSVPRGFYSASLSRAAEEAGYHFVFTSEFDLNSVGGSPLGLKRLVVTRGISFEAFDNMIYGTLGSKRYFERAKAAARGFVKPEFYDALAGLKQALRQKDRT